MLNQWSDRIVFVWILFVLKQYYVYHMQFALECAKTDPCEISPFQFMFVTICKNDSISIASFIDLLFSTIPLHVLIVIIHFCSSWFIDTYNFSFYSIQMNGTYQKLNYAINYKYALFYLPIHNDGKHQLCISNTGKSHSFGNLISH